MMNNKGVTLVNMLIIIIVLVIIAGVSISGGLDILNSSKESNKEENLAAVKSVVNEINIKLGTAGVFTPGHVELYGESAVGVLSGDSDVLANWYILDQADLEDLGITYVDENYLVNYEENKVFAMSEYEADNSILIVGGANSGE